MKGNSRGSASILGLANVTSKSLEDSEPILATIIVLNHVDSILVHLVCILEANHEGSS